MAVRMVAGADERPPVYQDPASGGLWVFRASSADLCETALVAIMVGVKPTGMPQALQSRMDEGTRLEPVILEALERRGYQVEMQQGAVELKVGSKALIRGHYDAIVTRLSDGKRFVTDAKKLGPTLWSAWKAKGVDGLLPTWKPQMAVYMEGTQLPGLYALGQPTPEGDDILDFDVWEMDTPPASVGGIKAKIIRCLKRSEMGVAPDLCTDVRWPCPVYEMMHPDKDRKPVVEREALDTERIDLLASEYAGLKAQIKRMEGRVKEISQEILAISQDIGLSVPATGEMKRGTPTGCVIPGERWQFDEVRRWMPERVSKAGEQRYVTAVKLEGAGAGAGEGDG